MSNSPVHESPEDELNSYLAAPGRLKAEHEWRAVVEYRCKRSHLCGEVIKLRECYVLYTLRRESKWSSSATDMLFVLPPVVDAMNEALPVSVGGCKCQPVRSRELGIIWQDIEVNRGKGKPTRVAI